MQMELPQPGFAVTPYGDVDRAVLENLRQEFDTSTLLEFVEQLAPMARRFQANGGFRDEILRLHRMAHTVVNHAPMSEPAAEDIWELAADLIEQLHQVAVTCTHIASELQPLADLQPPE